MNEIAGIVLGDVIATFRKQKDLAERAIKQLREDQLRQPLDANTNSIAVVMKHVAGNMISRWSDFLTTDGEKPWRDRDTEFVDDFTSLEQIMEYWERGWAVLFNTLESLEPSDLVKTVRIRGESHSVSLAILRQLDHYGYHVGQIVLTARLLAGDNWTTLSIPRGGSREYNQRTWKS